MGSTDVRMLLMFMEGSDSPAAVDSTPASSSNQQEIRRNQSLIGKQRNQINQLKRKLEDPSNGQWQQGAGRGGKGKKGGIKGGGKAPKVEQARPKSGADSLPPCSTARDFVSHTTSDPAAHWPPRDRLASRAPTVAQRWPVAPHRRNLHTHCSAMVSHQGKLSIP